jgi:hypothetical protein
MPSPGPASAGRLWRWTSVALLLVATLRADAAAAECGNDGTAFNRGCRAIEVSGLYQLEAWDENESRDTVTGATLAISWAFLDGWALVGEAVGYWVAQPGTPARLGGGLVLLRRQLHRRGHLSLFADAGLGASYADTPVPTRGTRYNYLLQAGAGWTSRVSRRADVIGHIRHLHLSNNGLAGSSRNPDIQSLGVQIGLLIRLRQNTDREVQIDD